MSVPHAKTTPNAFDDPAAARALELALDTLQIEADAILADKLTHAVINVGCGEDLTIRELSELIASVVGFRGEIIFDPSKPDGTPRKLMDISRLAALGWKPHISLREGLAITYRHFLEEREVAPGPARISAGLV